MQGVQPVELLLGEKKPNSQLEQFAAPDSEYVPIGQNEQLDSPETFANEPAEQFVQTANLPPGDTVPALQGVHILEPGAETVPGAQLAQAANPDSEYVPLSQMKHSEAPLKLLLPAEQLTHALWPVKALNCPAVQLRQNGVPSAGAYVPTGQAVQLELLVNDVVPFGHGKQKLAPVPE